MYVGQTEKLFTIRLKEHQKDVFAGDCETSTLAEYVMITGHETNDTVLASCRFLDQRLYLESWYMYIHQQQSGLNRERGPLPFLYQSLVTRQ